MKRIVRTEKLIKTFVITDEGEELLIEVSKKSNKSTDYLTLTPEEETQSVEG
jgi:hypothetical protein